MSTISHWIDTRVTIPPPGFTRRLASEREMGDRVSAVFVEEGLAALRASLREPSGSREAAFGLLAADAFATYACEAAADSGQVDEALRRILSEVANGIR